MLGREKQYCPVGPREQDGLRSGGAVTRRVGPGFVDIVSVGRVLDGSDACASGDEFRDELLDQGRLSNARGGRRRRPQVDQLTALLSSMSSSAEDVGREQGQTS